MRLFVGQIPSDSDNESSVTELLKQVGLEEGLEQIRERARAQGREEGCQQGGIQTAQQIAISIVAKRFPELELLAKVIITTISDLNQLQMLTIELSVVSSQERAKELLLSLVSAA
ncbi:MAG TPA: hypothetical protein VN207_12695 [Ktedonobacteraceae bacterium]|nr:hypothetical protein [Ktedonobacteraceae bacterium]